MYTSNAIELMSVKKFSLSRWIGPKAWLLPFVKSNATLRNRRTSWVPSLRFNVPSFLERDRRGLGVFELLQCFSLLLAVNVVPSAELDGYG